MSEDRIATLTEDNFDEEIRRDDAPILVDFWAPWCGPCNAIAPLLEHLAGELDGRARIAKVNVEENGDLAHRYGILSVPTLMVFHHGRLVDQVIGAVPEDHLRALLERHA